MLIWLDEPNSPWIVVASLPGHENQSFGSVFRTILSSGSIPPPSLRGGQNGRGCCVMRPRNPAKGVHRKRKRQHRRIARQTTPTYENEDAAASTTPPVPSETPRPGQVKAAGLPGGLARRSSFMLSVISTSTRDLVRRELVAIRRSPPRGLRDSHRQSDTASVRAWVGRAQRRILILN